ncbi:EF-hand domain-containing protein [Rhizorhabdus sp. FW153]|uniref:EF-hand domain-containing protein n=1 Tax=Rhizorhabdus sp. FW153 TaxID=3400216 RepID=UPI003CEB7500
MRRVLALLLLVGLSGTASARKEVPATPCSEPFRQPLFISPIGEPFRTKDDADQPMRRWFDQADRDHDGRLTMAEMLLDADRFFAALDKDGSGEILPDELTAYELNVAPEIRLYQFRGEPRGTGAGAATGDAPPSPPPGGMPPKTGGKRPTPPDFGGAAGAGRYSFVNVPNPVASSDRDFDRAISLREYRAAAAERFRDVDKEGRGYLALADLPRTPAQIVANAQCVERVKDRARERRK